MYKYNSTLMQATQMEQARPDQVKNSAGGFVFTLSDMDRLKRFLVLGSESPTYYASARKLSMENAQTIEHCWTTNPTSTANTIRQFSLSGRIPKNSTAIFALAVGVAHRWEYVRKIAVTLINDVCRTGTHLFEFVEYVDSMRGWGRLLRSAVADWYLSKDIRSLEYQLAKYQSREGWSHRDVLRLSHPIADSTSRNALFAWAVGKGLTDEYTGQYIHAMEWLNTNPNASISQVVDMINTHKLTREMIPTKWLNKPEVQKAMLPHMPLTALIRNLGNLSKSGLLSTNNWDIVDMVESKLSDEFLMKKARIHPIQFLSAYRVYSSGTGVRGSGYWTPVPRICDALESSFVKAFNYVEPSNKRLMVSIDVSGSMDWSDIAGIPGVTPAVGAAVMSMVFARTEKYAMFNAFAGQLETFPIRATSSLDDITRMASKFSFGGTDCAQPMIHATKMRQNFDAFIIFTDNETWAGQVHPCAALQQYRRASGINAKLVVVGMTSTGFTIADPKDNGSLDVVGFDAAAPNVIRDFIAGNV